MAKLSPNPLDNHEIARRLRMLRHMISGSEQGSQLRFANRVGIEYRRWNNFERGHPLPRDMAVHLIRAIPGITLDWLYLGRDDSLTVKLQRELREAGNALTLLEEGNAGPSRKATSSVR